MPLRQYATTWCLFVAIPVWLIQINWILGVIALLAFGLYLILED